LADSTAAALARMEAKLEALAKENKVLRGRLDKLAPRVASVTPTTATDASPASAGTVKMSGPAYAANYPVKAAAAPLRAPCSRFAGLHAGVSGGWAYHDKTWVDRDAWVDNFSSDWAIGSVNTTDNGAVIGGELGYDWQRNCTVFGVVIDGSWADLSTTKTYTPTAAAVTTLTLENRVEWFGTARTRTGVIVDDVLLYVTGGIAYANIKNNFTVRDTAIPALESFSADRDRYGWVGGVGVEWAWTQNWSVKSEVLYIRFNEVHTTANSPAGAQVVNFDNQDSLWVSRIGINYRWN
jgi:outer membrane immunogenic protein